MDREQDCRLAAGRGALLAVCLAFLTCGAHAQDAEPTGAVPPAANQPLISLPSTPAPGAAGKTAPTQSGSGETLGNGATINRASSLDKSSTLVQKSAAHADVDNQEPLSDSLGGIVTTDTVTLAGEDFYSAFARAWSANPLSDRYIVSVHERPSARYGSLVWVQFEQQRVFQAFLPIARSNVRAIAESAAAIALQNVMQADISRLLFRDADLATDEL